MLDNDQYIQHKTILQERLNGLEQEELMELFQWILKCVPNVPFTKNKNGYFLDIKQLPEEVLVELLQKSAEYTQ